MSRSLEGNDTSLRVRVRCVYTTLDDEEVIALDDWVAAHPFDGIDHISVASRAISVHVTDAFTCRGVAAFAIRHPGRLVDALDEAIARLRNVPYRRAARQ